MAEKNICYNCFKEIGESKTCPHCGFNLQENREKHPLALSCGTAVGGKYILGRALGQGGFGITYIAQDFKTKELVAVKEYFPDTLAMRTNEHTVSSYSDERRDNFIYGKKCFLEEAKTLSEFIGNPNIVRIFNYFEENDTAYFAMEYIDGISLKEYLKNHGGKIEWEEAKRIIFPVMDALSAVHSKGIIHRDISTDNIYIKLDGTVKLLDFGAARYSMGDKSRSLDVVLKHGYAPKEQYARHGRQGPYTDVYALAATIYRSITGKLPPDSLDRIEDDDLAAPSTLGVKIPEQAEDALIKALSVAPVDRYQDMASFKNDLGSLEKKPDPIVIPNTDSISDSNTDSSTDSNTDSSLDSKSDSSTDSNTDSNSDSNSDSNTNTVDKKKKFKLIAAAAAACVVIAVISVVMAVVLSKPASVPSVSSLDKIQSEAQNDPDSDNSESSNSSSSSSSSVDYSKTFNYAVLPARVTIVKYKGNSSSVSIPSEIEGKPVTKIKERAFMDNTSLTSITIPDSVTSIGKWLFCDCTGLTSVTIPDSITSIGDGTFCGCESLKSITIPDSVTSIGEDAFYGCDSLTSVTIPNSVTSIGDSTFRFCESLTSVTIPDSVTSIGEHAFAKCTSLTSASVPSGCEIGEDAFDNDVDITYR